MNILSRQTSCVSGQLLTWQVMTAEKTSCNRHSVVKKMPMSFNWHTEKKSFTLNCSNLCFLNAETVCRVYKSIFRESEKELQNDFLRMCLGRIFPIAKVYSLCFPIYFPYLENRRQMPTLKIHIILPLRQTQPERRSTGCIYGTSQGHANKKTWSFGTCRASVSCPTSVQ